MEKGAQPVIIVRKKKGHGHGHHGGSWKVAFADFMTAMMAFFLLLWILQSTTREEQLAIAGYFNEPGSRYVIGPGGANPDVIELTPRPQHAESAQDTSTIPELTEDELRRQLEQAELDQLEELRDQLEAEISMDSVFELLKDQILIDFTALGLRIQIVDKEQRPMFDIGSARLKYYSTDVLHALAPIINKVPNKISVTGHTDSTPYGAGASYTNWELSADRANSARRALLEGSYPEAKVATVQGMGSIAPLLEDKPTDPINRRIAIIVLKKAVSDALASGGSGLKSSDFIDPVPPSPLRLNNSGNAERNRSLRVMSESEVDAAIDAAIDGESR